MIALVASFVVSLFSLNNNLTINDSWWKVQSVDTVKYSRDLARSEISNPNLDSIIDEQVKDIADIGANYVAIDTPYDEEFRPYLIKWVESARRHNLNVWFRGNFSGWEKWFDYQSISSEDHLKMTSNFILNNPDLFKDGDIFTACPECENGTIGDPRSTGNLDEYRSFMINEYQITKNDFKKINKKVISNFNSMNGDVAMAVMDKPTTQSMDGIVTIDHYVADPEKITDYINLISENSGGKIVLGEFGAPIPDLNGNLDEDQQSIWINEALNKIAQSNNIIGINYWTNINSTTQLWNNNGIPRKAVSIVKNYYSPQILRGSIKNEIGQAVRNADVYIANKSTKSDNNGYFSIPYINHNTNVNIYSPDYMHQIISIDDFKKNGKAILIKYPEDFWFRAEKLFYSIYTSRFRR